MKAYRIITDGFDTHGITFADTTAKARASAVDSYADAYDVSWRYALTHQRVIRAPEYDDLAGKAARGKCYTEEYVRVVVTSERSRSERHHP